MTDKNIQEELFNPEDNSILGFSDDELKQAKVTKNYLPTPILRTAIFTPTNIPEKTEIDNKEGLPVGSSKGLKVQLFGSKLYSPDAQVLLAIINFFKNQGIDKQITFHLSDIMHSMQITISTANYAAIKQSLERLTIAKLKLEYEINVDSKNRIALMDAEIAQNLGYRQKKLTYYGSFIHDMKIINGEYTINLNQKLAQFYFTGNITYINQSILSILKTNPLAQAIYRFFSTHRDPMPHNLDILSNTLGIESISDRAKVQSYRIAVKKLNNLTALTNKKYRLERVKEGHRISCTRTQSNI